MLLSFLDCVNFRYEISSASSGNCGFVSEFGVQPKRFTRTAIPVLSIGDAASRLCIQSHAEQGITNLELCASAVIFWVPRSIKAEEERGSTDGFACFKLSDL